ncbi:MAG: DNA gyrase inhibitor YacG [Planctomycetota bacterium]
MRCPLCKKEFDPAGSEAMPFCSERCRTIDLGRWLGEEYSLPHVPDPEDDEQPEGFAGNGAT